MNYVSRELLLPCGTILNIIQHRTMVVWPSGLRRLIQDTYLNQPYSWEHSGIVRCKSSNLFATINFFLVLSNFFFMYSAVCSTIIALIIASCICEIFRRAGNQLIHSSYLRKRHIISRTLLDKVTRKTEIAITNCKF